MTDTPSQAKAREIVAEYCEALHPDYRKKPPIVVERMVGLIARALDTSRSAVPEPTAEQMKAGEQAWMNRNLADPESNPIRDCYKAMLTAAPPAPSVSAEQSMEDFLASLPQQPNDKLKAAYEFYRKNYAGDVSAEDVVKKAIEMAAEMCNRMSRTYVDQEFCRREITAIGLCCDKIRSISPVSVLAGMEKGKGQ